MYKHTHTHTHTHAQTHTHLLFHIPHALQLLFYFGRDALQLLAVRQKIVGAIRVLRVLRVCVCVCACVGACVCVCVCVRVCVCHIMSTSHTRGHALYEVHTLNANH